MEISSSILSITSMSGVKKQYRTLESIVWQFVQNETKTRGKRPSSTVIRKFALETYQNAGHRNFKASFGWFRRWRKRYDIKKMTPLTSTRSKVLQKQKVCFPVKDITDNLSSSASTDPIVSNTLEEIPISSTLENFSLENIDWPPDLFTFNEDGGDMSKNTNIDADTACLNSLVKELMHDFGRYFVDTYPTAEPPLPPTTAKPAKKYCKYDKDFKNKVLRFLNNRRIVEAAKKYNVNANTISIWLKDDQFQKRLTKVIIDKVTDEKSSKQAVNDKIDRNEANFIEWLLENEKCEKIISKVEVEGKIIEFSSAEWSTSTHWYAKYCRRYLQDKHQLITKIHYSEMFKNVVVSYAKKTSQIKAASVFKIARKQLFNWMKAENSLDAEKTPKKRNNDELLHWFDSQIVEPSGSEVRKKAKEIYSEKTQFQGSYGWYRKWCQKNGILVKRNCDDEIVEWILSIYDSNFEISHEDVQKQAVKVYKNHNQDNFKASQGWLLRFCRRFMDLLRRIPPLTVPLTLAYENKVAAFRERVCELKSKHNIKADAFGVMDEIPLKLKPMGMVNNQKKPLLRSCGLNNAQGSVIMSCLADGSLLPIVITLKDKDISNSLHRHYVLCQSDEVIDNNVIQFWIENIWFKHVRKPSLLLVDSYPLHSSELIKCKFANNESYLEIMPAGCSSKLNPLLHEISTHFQEAIDRHCKKWFDENSYSWHLGSGSSLSSNDILNWVLKAYESVERTFTPQMIRNVFKEMRLQKRE